MGETTRNSTENESMQNSIGSIIQKVTTPLWDRVAETIQSKFPIREDIDTPESIEKIKNAFLFYKNEVLPLILDNPKVTQQKEWYHWLYTHTENVVFRGICYAVSLWEDPIPVVFACACHDLARVHNWYDEKHWPNAVPVTTEIINNEKFNLTEEQKQQIIEAVRDHTTWKWGEAPNYISACLWDADRTRLSRDRGYIESCYNTEMWKKIWSWSREDFTEFQNLCLNHKGPDTITPEEFKSILKDRDDVDYLKEKGYITSPNVLMLYDIIINLPRIQELSEESRKSFLAEFFLNITTHCDVNACMEIIPSLVNEGYVFDIIKCLSIREDNKNIIKSILDDIEIIDLLDQNIQKNTTIATSIPKEIGSISRIVTIDNFQYLKDCLKLNVDIRYLPYFREDTSEIIQQYLSWNERQFRIWRTLDRIHRKWHTLQSISAIFGDELITPLTERLLEFKDFDKFKNIWIDEYKNLSTEDKKLFLNGFISALTPYDIEYPDQSWKGENFQDLQKRMKIFEELQWDDDVQKRLKNYNDMIKKLLNEIPDDERFVCKENGGPIYYRTQYREKNKIPPLVDDIEKVLEIHTENIKWRQVKVAELDFKTDLWVSTHRFDSIESIEALEVTNGRIFLAIGTNWWTRDLNVTKTGYALIVKPRNIWNIYAQGIYDVDSWTWCMKNLYNFEHVTLPWMWDHCGCISLVPNAIKEELNLSQEEYTKRINALWNVTTLQEVWEKDKELELCIRRVLKKVRMYEWLLTPTVMWMAIWEKELNEVDDDILDYCVRRDIPLVKIKYPKNEQENNVDTSYWLSLEV